TIKNELDFTKEGENADIFRKNFRYDKGIAVPQIRWIYTTKRILTMEYIDGIPINDSHALEQAGIDKRMVAERLAISICNQILRDGFFHADPHPGNIQVLPDGTIVFLDLGMVGRLSAKRKKMLSNFFIGAASKDSALVVRSMMDMDAVSDPGNLRKFEREVDEIIEKYLTMPMNEIKIDALLYEIFQFAFKNQIRIPQEFALLAKSLGILQSLLERLAPDLNALFIAKPIAKKLLRQSFSPEELSREAKKSAWNYGSLLNRFPSFLLNLMNRLEDKDYSMEVKWKGFSAFQRRIEKIFNRISLSMVLLAVSIIIAGVIIGSGASANTGSEMYQLNLLILKSGLLLALILLLVLIISIFRSGRR
ncbi:MAG: AarF/UbiB family protein, partial [Oscillospiraceae bacterium]|nr:AarF/UbiB family protein [Oscillospiraceae bacterium]